MGTTATNDGYSVTVAITSAWWSGRTLVYTAKLDVNTNGTYYTGLYSTGSLYGTGATTASHASAADLNGQYTSTRMFDITGYVAADASGNASASVGGSWGSTYPFYYNGWQIGMSAVSAYDSGSWHIATPPTNSGFNSITRTPGTGTFSIEVSTVSSPVGTPTYYVQRSENGGAWGWDQSSTGRNFTFTGASFGSSQQFRVAAYNVDGWSSWVYSGTYTVPNVPGVPGPVTATITAARTVTVVTGAAAANNAAVTAYYAQASDDNGTTWGSDTLMSAYAGAAGAAVFSDLTGGKTYAFRVRAVNEMGYSAYSTPVSNIFIAAGGKRYNGSSFVNTSTASRRNETNTGWTGINVARKFLVSGPITNVVKNGSSVTYTATNNFTKALSSGAGNRVTITGVQPDEFSPTDALVTAATSTSFTINVNTSNNVLFFLSNAQAKGWFDFD